MVDWTALLDSISVYIGPSPRETEKKREKRKIRERISKQPPPAPIASAVGPCSTIIQTSTQKKITSQTD